MKKVDPSGKKLSNKSSTRVQQFMTGNISYESLQLPCVTHLHNQVPRYNFEWIMVGAIPHISLINIGAIPQIFINLLCFKRYVWCMLQMIVDMMSDAKRLLITSRKKIKYFKKLHQHVPNCIFIQYQIFLGVFFYYFFFLQVVFTLNLNPPRLFSSRQGGDTPKYF